ncbi:MAG: flagellar hook assembly protein FlgD [Rhodobacteraceae bacterium]|nr:flagellar hook assembly protein FlgD [Paracoccaceae bacterium]
MTTISPVAGSTTTTQTHSTSSALSSDFDTFLTMLTAQIQNQDPLNPMDSSDYAVQLATFSGVEQQVQTNDLLRGLTGGGLSGIAGFAGWVGMEALAEGPVHFDGTPVSIQFDLPAGARTAQLVVSTPAGQELHRNDITGTESPMEWDGQSASGSTLLTGNYQLHVETVDATGETVSTPVTSFARVVELRDGADGPELVLDTGTVTGVGSVTALRDT